MASSVTQSVLLPFVLGGRAVRGAERLAKELAVDLDSGDGGALRTYSRTR